MESENKNEIKELLGNLTDFKSELDSGKEELENPDGKAVEKYFNTKLVNLLEPESSHTNIKINLSQFFEELRLYIFSKTFNDDKLDKKVAQDILEQIREYFDRETEMEIDSFFTKVPGEKIQNLFQLIKNYSFPKIVEINPKEKYTVIVESTYCLKKNIVKKCEQLRKNYLFFSILSKYYKNYKEYFEDLYEYFFKKYIFSKNVTVYDYIKDKNFNLSEYDNYIILFVSNSKFDLFKSVAENIEKSKPFEKEEFSFNIKKCFQFPLIPKKAEPKLLMKEFLEEKNESEIKINHKKKADETLLLSYKKFNYLIDNINNQTNFKVKLVYLDLYLNVLAPKCEIISHIDKLMSEVNNNKREITESNNKISSIEGELQETKMIINALVEEVKKNNPNFRLENLIKSG